MLWAQRIFCVKLLLIKKQEKDLKDIVLTLTLDNLLLAPKNTEIISFIEAKTAPYIQQTHYQ
jgi:hypothetical protein